MPRTRHSHLRPRGLAARLASLLILLVASIAAPGLLAPALAAPTATTTALKLRARVEGAAIRLDYSTYGAGVPVNSYEILRKRRDDATWTTTLLSFAAGHVASTYLDATAEPGVLYEYKVTLSSAHADYNKAYGVVAAGVAVAPVHDRGRVLLVVEQGAAEALPAELARFRRDLVGDGWRVTTLLAPRHVDYPTAPNSLSENANPAAQLKARLRSARDADPAGTRAVILLGHVQVPYSGRVGYDGHGLRALPTDIYYGNFTDTWTDSAVNDTSWDGGTNTPSAPAALGARNDNVPGDGKFDQSFVTRNELYVGRIDTAALPSLGEEYALLRRYLEKNHRWRHAQIPTERRAVYYEIHDTRLFSHADPTLRRELPALYPDDALIEAGQLALPGTGARYLHPLQHTPHEFVSIGSYGGYSWNDGLGLDQLVHLPSTGVFYGLYGSYFGDFDSTDNLLRAVLAQPRYGLAAYLGGTAPFHLAPTAMGRPWGEGQLDRLDRSPTAPHRDPLTGTGRQGYIWHNLQGDPTLRLAPLPAPRRPRLDGGVFSWDAPPEPVDGYYVYSAPAADGPFTLRTPDPLTTRCFATPAEDPPGTVYQVRAVKLIAPYGGSFHALSQGVFSDANLNGPPMVVAGPDQQIYESLAAPISARVADDGFPVAGTLRGRWSVLEGCGAVSFDDPAAPSTTARFAAPGEYRLAYTADDGELTDTHALRVVVSADVVEATHDTQADESLPAVALGLAPELRADDSAGRRRVVYLQFDLGVRHRRPVGTTLRLRLASVAGGVGGASGAISGYWTAHAVADATWSENSLTWQNAPAFDPAPLGCSRIVVPADAEAWIDIDLGATARTRTGKLALALVAHDAELVAHARSSRAGTVAPRLILAYDPTDTQQGVLAAQPFDLADGTRSLACGSIAWSLDTSAAPLADAARMGVRSRAFEARNTGGEVVWTSETLPLYPGRDHGLSLTVRGTGALAGGDYVRAGYRLDGGPEVNFGEITGAIITARDDWTAYLGTAPLRGRTVQIVIRARAGAADAAYAWDDLRLFTLDGALGPPTYVQWTRAQGLRPTLDVPAPAAAPEATPANDGVSNLLKYALGLPPSHIGLGGRIGAPRFWSDPRSPGGPVHLALPVTLPSPAPPGLRYLPQASSDLVHWDTPLVEVERTDNGDGTHTVLYRDPTPFGGDHRFLRLMVETN